MASLREQLFQQGMVSEQQFRRGEEAANKKMARQLSKAQGKTKRSDDGYTLSDLDQASSMSMFKERSRGLLLRYPSEIGEVIKLAHRFKEIDPDTSRQFIWTFYQLKRLLPDCPTDKLEQLLARSLRRNNPQVKIPE